MSDQSRLLVVLEEIREERAKQDDMWGGPEHDDTHTSVDWLDFIASRNVEAAATTSPYVRRKKLLAVAALAVAAIESFDRIYGPSLENGGKL